MTDTTVDLLGQEQTKQGSRMTPEWKADGSFWREAAGMNLTDEQIDEAGESFRDYWLAVAGQKGAKTNWLATWRNYLKDIYIPRHDVKAANRADGLTQHNVHVEPGFGSRTKRHERELCSVLHKQFADAAITFEQYLRRQKHATQLAQIRARYELGKESLSDLQRAERIYAQGGDP